jgi:hypothetical protein
MQINNLVTKLLKNDDNNTFSILTYLDLKKVFTHEYIFNYVKHIIDNNCILKKEIVRENYNFFLQDVDNFDIYNHFSIKYVNKNAFDNYIKDILNDTSLSNIFYLLCCIDKKNNRSRLYLKINHSYADGYSVIDMLTKKFINYKDKFSIFNRNTTLLKTLYHYIIGTIVLLFINIKFLFNIQTKSYINTNETDYIKCKAFHIDKIKQFTKKNNITVNDFLYAVMIKTDQLYTKQNRNVTSCSSINVSKLSNTNNMCPIFNSINNSLENKTLFKTVHTIFDHYKYSLFIPMLDFLINNFITHVNIDFLAFTYNSVINNTDYIYSNIIGPPVNEINKISHVHLKNIHFLTTAGNGITYNIISCKNKINIICSFKKGKITNKKRFKKCIYNAYENLITSEECV